MNQIFLVFGGRVRDALGHDFADLADIEVVGFFRDRASAEAAWRGAAQRTVDDAEMRYLVADLGLALAPQA